MRFLLLMGLLAAAAGCSSEESSGGTGGASGAGGSAGAAGSPPECPGPGYHTEPAPVNITDVTGRVVDLSGSPVPNISATVCGTDICIYGNTDAQGQVVSNCDDLGVCASGISPNQEIKKPAFKYALGITHVEFASALPPGATDVGDMKTAALPDASTGVDMVAGADASSGGVTLSIPADSLIKIDKLTYENEQHWKFRAVEIPIANAPQVVVDSGQGFEVVVGTTPVHTTFCPAAKLSVPNTPGWAAGTEVEFWMHGVDPGEEWAPYSGWAKVSDGAVSADGSAIVTADGQGVHELSVFGIKQK